MSLNVIIDADVASASQKIQSFAKDSRIALTNLSLVVQDLPYGFIGIQNNLPFLAKSFQELSAASGGTLNAFKAIATGLTGPAGLFFAFSAVTSIITATIQEYGSLGNAIQILTSKNSLATESQLKFNKALNEGIANSAAESSKINILIKSISDLKKPLSERQSAYYELKKIQPDIVRGISDENALNADSITIINNLAKARLEYVKLKIQENAISNILNQNAAKSLVLEQEVLNVANNLAATIEKRTKLEGKSLTAREQESLNVLIEREKVLTKQLTDVTNEYIRLNNVTQSYLDKLSPLLANIANYDYANRQLTETIKSNSNEQKKNTEETIKYIDALSILKKINKEFVPTKAISELGIENAAKRGIGPKNLAPNYSAELKEIIAENEQFKKKFLETKVFLENSVFKPLEDVFQIFFEKGTSGFKEMGKIIMQQIRKLAAQIIASGIVTLIASLINPIGAVATSGPKALDLFSILGNAAKNVLGGQIGRPGFGGVNPGGVNFGGQVSVVLRGQDLIGAINRTNLQIDRLG